MTRPVKIEWWDATMEGGWVENADAERCEDEPVMVTIGFVVGENANWIKVAQTDGVNEKGNIIKLPKKWIKSMRSLEV